ncbi:MAG: M15 family metallopeptidase, partial [Planctomycetes bacterium]|nr:M15 family metallopeptidase [Planctomycetota bacterium]
AHGYGITMGDAFRDKRCNYGHAKSLHRQRLAVDINLFVRTPDERWDYMALTDDHTELGEYWESLGGSWGGRFDDGNHYSLEHDGVK